MFCLCSTVVKYHLQPDVRFFFEYFNIQWVCDRPQMHKNPRACVLGAQKPPLDTPVDEGQGFG